jgi:hypothetical protein
MAVVVVVAAALPYLHIVPRRSLGSILVGATIVIASFVELALAPVLAYRLAASEHHRSAGNWLCLLAGLAATVPAIGVTVVALRG